MNWIQRIASLLYTLSCREKCKREWLKKNGHNNTVLLEYADISTVKVGNYTYGGLRVKNDRSDRKISIGSFCSIGNDVVFLVGQEHDYSRISTFPFKARCLRSEKFEASSKGDIIIDDDVWIGYGAKILSGVHIGQGAIVGAGAVVTKDVEPYAIVAGIPAKEIRKRFNKNMVEALLKVDYGKLTREIVEAHIEELYEPLVNKEQLQWFPKKGDI